MEQPAPTTAQNTNDDEEEEIIIDTEDKQVVFTLAEVGRRADGDGIDTESPCIGPLRAVQFLKVASQKECLRLPLPKNDGEQRALDEKIEEIKAAVSSRIENAAVPFFGNLAKRGVAPSARDAAVSVSLCRKTESLFRKRADDLDTSDVRRAGFDLQRLARGFGERKKTGFSTFSREWQRRFKERDADAHKEWLEQRTRDLSKWARKGNISQFHGGEEGYALELEARVSKCEEIVDSGTLPGEATGLRTVLVGGYSLGIWCRNVARNYACTVNYMILDHKPLVKRLAALADRNYDALVGGVPRGFQIASQIHRAALTCKKGLDDDWSPVSDDELMKNLNFGRYTIDEEAHKLLHLRNVAIKNGLPVHESEKVKDWDVISYKPPSLASANARPLYIDPSRQKQYNQMSLIFTDPEGTLKPPTKDELTTRLAGKHPDSLVSDEQFKEEFVAELRSLGASDEDVELVSREWGVERGSSGHKKGFLDEDGNAISKKGARVRFGVATPAPAEALDENWARDAESCLETINKQKERKQNSKLNLEDVRETLTKYGFTGPKAPWPVQAYIKTPKHWPKNPKKSMQSVLAVKRYLEGILEDVDAKAGGVGVGVGVDEEGVEDDDALEGSATAEQISGSAPAPAPSDLDSDDANDLDFLNAVYPSSKAEQTLDSAPAPAPSDLDDGQEKKEPDASSSDDCEIIEPPPPAPVPSAPVDYMTMSSAQAMAMTIVGGHGDAPPSAAPVAAPAPGEAAEVPAAPSPSPAPAPVPPSQNAVEPEFDFDSES
ncbi:unnamed protein product [Pelagomonas calceolata]|uniref:Uncharacterized protein n=2 Tax=Pelagomonas calceolata TaxID=35677 RepID=A0A8J2SHJ2_9STRA|nr:unnamed protein product [Pelagomonas calceolata]